MIFEKSRRDMAYLEKVAPGIFCFSCRQANFIHLSATSGRGILIPKQSIFIMPWHGEICLH
ncbi:hypothetical protein NJLHNGOC_12205 [Novacetimonas cocois]|uniref:Uncharacterized protein n=1 Tax=Novacetimonas cocois TaxID=1747507 RepID=A0A365YSM6_9PROT|nr:hypothetical protein NJLHNGOC_12205 [Novacetimonas cocois]